MSELSIYRTAGYRKGEKGLEEAEAFFSSLVPGEVIETEQWSSRWCAEEKLQAIVGKQYYRLFIIQLINLTEKGNKLINKVSREDRDNFVVFPEAKIKIISVKTIGNATQILGEIQ